MNRIAISLGISVDLFRIVLWRAPLLVALATTACATSAPTPPQTPGRTAATPPAQVGRVGAQAPSSTGTVLSGRVVLSDSVTGVAKARVWTDPMSATATTDSLGQWAIRTNLGTGFYKVIAESADQAIKAEVKDVAAQVGVVKEKIFIVLDTTRAAGRPRLTPDTTTHAKPKCCLK